MTSSDVETTKARALANAEKALQAHEQHKEMFDENNVLANPVISSDVERPQPSIFEGTLKGYQLKVSDAKW